MRAVRLALVVVALLAVMPPAVAAPNDPGFAQQWALPQVGAEQGWSRTCGAGIVIAVVDTGVDLDHQDILGRLAPGRDFIDGDNIAQDANGHGTHVAGIAAAATANGVGVAGVAPQARIMPVRVLDRDGRGDVTDVDAGIRWAADHGAQVINLSLGEDSQLPLSKLVVALNYAWQKGSIPVLAAGNTSVEGSDTGDTPAIVVTATTPDDRLANYATGVGSARWAMAAPGGQGDPADSSQRILSTYFDPQQPQRSDVYAYLAGTSQAAPHVAGAAALLRSAGLSPQQTVDRLLSTARDLGPAGKDPTFGSGRLDVGAATAGLNGTACPFSATGPAPTVTSAPPATAAPATSTSRPASTTTTAAGSVTTSPDSTTSTSVDRSRPPSSGIDGGRDRDDVVLADLEPEEGDGAGLLAVPAAGLAGGAGYLTWRQRRLLPSGVRTLLPGMS